ncbi:MAG: hypothetical protein Q4B28_01340 [bacterium]|nr:hypothetical protein [bacterium]
MFPGGIWDFDELIVLRGDEISEVRIGIVFFHRFEISAIVDE